MGWAGKGKVGLGLTGWVLHVYGLFFVFHSLDVSGAWRQSGSVSRFGQSRRRSTLVLHLTAKPNIPPFNLTHPTQPARFRAKLRSGDMGKFERELSGDFRAVLAQVLLRFFLLSSPSPSFPSPPSPLLRLLFLLEFESIQFKEKKEGSGRSASNHRLCSPLRRV